MPFCYSPWNNIDIDPQGNITPCCKFQKQYYDEQFNIQTHSLEEYSKSKLVANIKKEFQQDKWPRGCERCQIEESNGIESKRQLDYTRWKDYYDAYDIASNKIITASIAFGNTCNLKCITCNPQASSRWQQEYYDIYGKDIQHFKFYKKNFVQDFIAQAPDIVHLDIPGGEPFLSGIDEQKELLSYYITTGQAKDVTLHYTTNAQIFPAAEWWELWAYFKEVDIQISIDGVDNRYEYIRYPASWPVLVENAIKYLEIGRPNIRLSVSHTVSAYNIYYLDEFFTWCYNIGLPRPWVGRVHNPAYMRPTVWAEPARTKIINQLLNSKHNDSHNWVTLITNNNDSELFEKFKENLYKHDQYRHLSFSTIFPELAEYV